MSKFFELNRNVILEYNKEEKIIHKASKRFFRDLDMTLNGTTRLSGRIILNKSKIKELIGSYKISFVNQETMNIEAADDLGIIYALLCLSERFLNIPPFWFWNDQQFTKKEYVNIPTEEIVSEDYRVKYRGWFINDEVLICNWQVDESAKKPWEMAFEALLRCGGNMVIPGTDKNSKHYASLASDMGLYITHHHAEPLGAEMFARAYPDLNPSFDEHKDLFVKLWKEGIENQKDKKIIWNFGFRGQGDVPFWENDARYDSDESRGELISSIIKYQYDLVCESVKNPVCCTNLYGEIMELYQKGYIKLPDDIIFVWADNGYGKMVSRRQGNHNPRIKALPEGEQINKSNGTYYHASFYDLQAANHITMLPNSIEFMEKELNYAYSQGIRDFWIINSSNIKPHVYYLNYISKLWKEEINRQDKCLEYINEYYCEDKELANEIYKCFENYAKVTIPFGKLEDEHSGEQFYNYSTRIFLYYWKMNQIETCSNELKWATGDVSFGEQVNWFKKKCLEGMNGFEQLYERCMVVTEELGKKEKHAKKLFEDSILLQVKIHYFCIKGSIEFCKGLQKFKENELIKAFYYIGKAADEYAAAVQAMNVANHDKWKGFYDNDCLSDVKQTVYLLKQMMGYIRNIGDGPHFYQWQREFLYKEEDKRVVLITNMENHLMDDKLYDLMKNSSEIE